MALITPHELQIPPLCLIGIVNKNWMSNKPDGVVSALTLPSWAFFFPTVCITEKRILVISGFTPRQFSVEFLLTAYRRNNRGSVENK